MRFGLPDFMIPGAIGACLAPMIIGLGATIGLWLTSPGGEDLLFTMPVAACFLFGTPLAAWIACRRLAKRKVKRVRYGWGWCFLNGLLGSTAVHVSAAMLYTFGFIGWALVDSASMSTAGFGEVLGFSLFFNAALWVILTFPFTLFCATVFWVMTEVPRQETVF